MVAPSVGTFARLQSKAKWLVRNSSSGPTLGMAKNTTTQEPNIGTRTPSSASAALFMASSGKRLIVTYDKVAVPSVGLPVEASREVIEPVGYSSPKIHGRKYDYVGSHYTLARVMW